MKKLLTCVLLLGAVGLCADNPHAQTPPSIMVPLSIWWSSLPANQAVYKTSCYVDIVVVGPGNGVQCIGTAVCTPGSLFSRMTINVSAAVEEFCPVSSGPMRLTGEGSILGAQGTGLWAKASIRFLRGKGRVSFNVFHDSNDDCNQAARYDNAPVVKGCPQPI